MDFDFQLVAAAWERWLPKREAAAHPVSRRLLDAAQIRPGSKVLDIGTGIGEPAITAARVVGDRGYVIGTDVSPAMVELARKRAERERVSNARFLLSDGLADVPDGPYDAVVSRWGMMFFADLDKVLGGVCALLRPGGSFATATWGKPQEVPQISLPMAFMTATGSPPPDIAGGPFALHDAVDLERRLRAAGFANVSSEPFEVVYVYAAPGEYFNQVADMTPPLSAHLAHLDESARATFRQAVEERVAQRFSTADGTIRIPNRALIASGTRPM